MRRPLGRDLWRQSFPFTCGPAALGGVLSALGWNPSGDRGEEELAIWRESTAVACPGAHPLGLALAARLRGFDPEVVWLGPRPWLWPHIRRDHHFSRKSEYVRIEGFFAREARAAHIPVRRGLGSTPTASPGLLLVTVHGARDERHDPHWVGVLPEGDGRWISDPLRSRAWSERTPLAGRWTSSGFEGTRVWIGLRPRKSAAASVPARLGTR